MSLPAGVSGLPAQGVGRSLGEDAAIDLGETEASENAYVYFDIVQWIWVTKENEECRETSPSTLLRGKGGWLHRLHAYRIHTNIDHACQQCRYGAVCRVSDGLAAMHKDGTSGW